MKIKLSTLLLALLFAISAAAQTPPHFDGQTWWNHIKVLADDKLEGRDTGSRGERAAQAYAVEQLKRRTYFVLYLLVVCSDLFLANHWGKVNLKLIDWRVETQCIASLRHLHVIQVFTKSFL